jgi:hypothetical protein
MPENGGQNAIDNLHALRYADGDITTADLRMEMQMCMQDHAAVYRTGPVLEEGAVKIDEIAAKFDNIKVQDRSLIWNTDLVETLELQNLLANASGMLFFFGVGLVGLVGGWFWLMSVLSCRSLVSHLIFSLCILQAQCMLHRQEKKVVVPMHVKIIPIVWIFRMDMNAARLRTMIGTRPVQDHEGTDGCTTHWPIGTKRPKKPGWNIETFIKCHWTKNAIILFQPNVFIKTT